MRLPRRVPTAAAVTLAQGASVAAATETADTVFTGGKVYTVDEKQPWAEAVAVQGNKVLYVGDAEGAKAFIGEATDVIER